MQEPWWKKSVVYQIYPKSFNDTTGSGTGDIEGVIEKLDYLKELGVDVLWLTPIYDSPQKDNGYDIRDYYSIFHEYGTMADVDRLLDEAHKRDLKVIFDIVVNHTSTEHKWFVESKKSKDNPYRDFYIWKDSKDEKEPTNWESKFGGNAWQYDDATDQYYLHLFDVTQADLNWENEAVRDHVYEMMNYWVEKGVDGFRLDVINLISKNQDFPEDTSDGRKFYTDGPKIHDYLQDMHQQVFKDKDLITVGEMSSTSIDNCVKYTHPDRDELSMTFSFHHLKVDYPNGEKWTKAPFDLDALKTILTDWQVGMHAGGGWNALFWCNHDQPRVVSRFGSEGKYHNRSAKMLATTLHMMQGTPYIFQGEEFGMTNPNFETIDDYRDVESLNTYRIMTERGASKEEVLDILKQKSRDNARTPMQWNDSAHAGFTDGTPWIDVARNYQDINAEKALKDQDSIFYYYQRLIRLRKSEAIITDGKYRLILASDSDIFAYVRETDDEQLVVLNNFYDKEVAYDLTNEGIFAKVADVLISNMDDQQGSAETGVLRPYESVVYHIK
ncbi:trehalose-6-phosphate hydrolase [Halolactibacillus halophilus]|uniref:Alpha,alpha-phosphotrehalase n=1 Tax=Halolactibacillus halophilus TaxID=306540 RepID=A0A1I5P4Y7_9BACI|nr:alpha,alpha-phosphotrehalase [Halolactibacillus halophilus]GEM01506.1 trehalose-6-phosphate hydrolase [Halolactibacillus halophilus]SFP28556.1 trehalose-6-phosphate hydrolase [Halolactibacillus halophilus]